MKRIVAILFALAALILVVSSACLAESGSGKSLTEERKTRAFSEVDVSGSVSVEIRVADSHRVEVTADDDIVPLISTKVDGDRLEIKTEFKDIHPVIKPVVRVWTTSLQELSLSGATKATVIGISNESLHIRGSGASTCVLSGRTKELDIHLSGAGLIESVDLRADTVAIKGSGAAKMIVQAREQLDVQISGAVSVTYIGNPEVTKEISGVALVKRRRSL